MKWLGSKVVKLDTIDVGSGFAKRKKAPHVKELARSIEANGVIALPVVRSKPRQLVAGGDRLAALMLLGITRHEVRLVEGTDEELEVLTLEENLTRRRGDDYDAMTARLVELTGEQIEEQRAEAPAELPANLTGNAEPEPRKPGRPKSAKGEARELVAKATGRTPEAVRQAEKRAKAEEKSEEVPSGPPPPPVDTFDIELPESVVAQFDAVRHVQAVTDEAGKLVAKALRCLTVNLSGHEGGLKTAAYNRCYSAVHDAADAIRRAHIDAFCPMCKALPSRVNDCGYCGSTGFVPEQLLQHIAPELLERGANAKVPDGRGGFMPVAKAPAKKASKPARGARKLRIENEHGDELVPDDVGQVTEDADELLF